MFIQELFKLHNNSKNSNIEIDDCKIVSILDEISEAIPEIESNLTQFNIVKKSICDIRECLNKKIDDLFVQFTTSQTLLSSSIRKLTYLPRHGQHIIFSRLNDLGSIANDQKNGFFTIFI